MYTDFVICILLILQDYLVLHARYSAATNDSAQSLGGLGYKEVLLDIYHCPADTVMHCM